MIIFFEIVLAIIAAIANAYAMKMGWNWFVSPTFGLTTLTALQAYALLAVYRFAGVNITSMDVRHAQMTQEHKTEWEGCATSGVHIFVALVMMGLFWCIHQFLPLTP